ncbi:MAG: hypothetical protein KJ950_08890 [Proteobacteria bacterium]|nr:hypothetical protein [Pseudomonadota bacterium]MBU1686609.1 hypothetical protein [Pseudomonadota bacterium]
MRPTGLLLIIVTLLLMASGAAWGRAVQLRQESMESLGLNQAVTAGLGLTDLCIATEARYTRHPSISDPMAPFMDHPFAIEHFPTGSFWAVPSHIIRVEKFGGKQ